MNNWLNKLERKYGRFGIPNLTNILVAGQILVFAIELFIDRTVTAVCGVDFGRVKAHKLQEEDWREIECRSSAMVGRKLEIIQAGGLSVVDIQALALAGRYDVIYIDYLQLIEPEDRRRTDYEKVTQISKDLHTMAQTSDSVEVDVTELAAMRRRLGENEKLLGTRVTLNDLLSYAAVKMLKTHPLANASYTDQEILTFPYVNLSVAVATDYGLTSPVVRDADQMSLVELSRALREIVVKAREKRLTADDQRDGTFTLTNMGVFPVDNFNPILPAPQSCIMGFGRAVEKPVVYQGQICVRTMMCLSVTYDHRVFDGGEIGSILKTMKEYLETPELFLAQ